MTTENKYRSKFFVLTVMLFSILLAGIAQAAQTVTYYHTDAAGSVVAASDTAGSLLWRKSYDPYGEKINDGEADPNAVAFTGKKHDDITGLSYFGARYYDPEVGRFMGMDAVGFKSGNLISFNRYVYANNNPYKFVDPDGNEAIVTYMSNGDITIDIPIKFSGSGARDNIIQNIKQNVNKIWSGKYTINGKPTNVTVNVTEPERGGVVNKIELTSGPTSLKKCQGCSFVRGGKSGQWNANKLGNNTAAHEAGHLMGAENQYDATFDKNGIRTGTTPKTGWKDNVMSDGAASTNDANMKQILSSGRTKEKRGEK